MVGHVFNVIVYSINHDGVKKSNYVVATCSEVKSCDNQCWDFIHIYVI